MMITNFFQWSTSSRTSPVSRKQTAEHDDGTQKLSGRLFINGLDSAGHTASCVFPDVNIYEPSVVEVSGMNRQTIQCKGTYLPDLTYVDGTSIIVNTSKVHESRDTFQHCKYRHVWRHESDDNNYTYSDWSQPFTDKIELDRNAEFVRVQCWTNETTLASNTYFLLVPRKEEYDEIDKVNFQKREIESGPKETLNIIMIAMDSLQRHQFIRGCNKTYLYLMKSLKSFDLTMHSQMGINTFPNLLPLFTDHLETEIRKWWHHTMPMDSFDMLWRIFENAGYCTMYTENSPTGGVFHWRNKGFKRPFARFYTRPVDLAMNDDDDLWKKHQYLCTGNQVELNMRLDYVGRLLDTFPGKPVFAVVMNSKETHDDQSNAKMFDEHIFNFYKSLNDKGHLNKTLLISFSDHGTRWGKLRDAVNGHFDSVNPYTILTFPEWFLKKYPDVAENLRINTKRLTSHFDTHATLLDLLYFKSDNPPPLAPIRHGMSLFKEIPWNRTCVDASIPLEFCLCGYREAEDIHINSTLSRNLTQFFMEQMNRRTESVCVPYILKQTMRVTKITFQSNALNEEHGDSFYKVKLQTSPGDGIFEAYIYVEQNSTVRRLSENIFRLNAYKGQSDCVSHPANRAMCYCKNLLIHQ
ncbi:hypothetical protein BsWGS_24899 [Bradybaena similaris]